MVGSRESQAPCKHDKNKGSDHPMIHSWVEISFFFSTRWSPNSRYPSATSIITRYMYILVLLGYLVWKVKTNGLRLGSCNLNSSWHQLVGISTWIKPWKIYFARCRIGIVKKYFWKQGKNIYVKKLTFFETS